MTELNIKFEWNSEKEKINISKHKINFTDASHVFSDVYQLNLFDERHSDNEDRWIVIGEIPLMKVVVVIHTFRQSYDSKNVLVRIISARKAVKKEKTDYLARRPI